MWETLFWITLLTLVYHYVEYSLLLLEGLEQLERGTAFVTAGDVYKD